MNDSVKTVTIKKNIHCPASYYFCSGYIPALAKEILQIINDYEKNSIYIKSINMNNNTYNWLFRLFTNPIENSINPLSSTADNKYIYDYPIKINSNGIIADGIITFDVGE